MPATHTEVLCLSPRRRHRAEGPQCATSAVKARGDARVAADNGPSATPETGAPVPSSHCRPPLPGPLRDACPVGSSGVTQTLIRLCSILSARIATREPVSGLFPSCLARACWGVRRCADLAVATRPSRRRLLSYGQPRSKVRRRVPCSGGAGRRHSPNGKSGSDGPENPHLCLAPSPIRLARACWGVRRCTDPGRVTPSRGRMPPYGQPRWKIRRRVPCSAGAARHQSPNGESGSDGPEEPHPGLAPALIRLARACWGVRTCTDPGMAIHQSCRRIASFGQPTKNGSRVPYPRQDSGGRAK